ncbi:hypothetical protein M3Y94_00855500 [Aphelenchoides besseyi]|nr:hypothetical protein M3Y94_00855500 [Aphelenchoides besseyi]
METFLGYEVESMDMFSYVREIFVDIRTFLVSLLVIMSLPIVFTYVFGNCVRVHNHKRPTKSYGRLATSEASIHSFKRMVLLSRLRLGKTFVAPRKYVLPQKYAFTRAWLQFSAGNLILIISGIVTVYWFGTPTPDIRHDVRCLMHRRYRHFASDNKLDPYLERGMQQQIRGFYVHEGEMREKAEYGSANETRIRVDV